LHKYTVDFTISGDDIEEAEVSGLLGLKPSVFLKKGELISQISQRKRESSCWSFFIDPPDGNREWQTLEAGLKCLIEILQPLKGVLGQLNGRLAIDAYCGHFGSGFGGGPSISPGVLGKLAGLGLTLTIKTYWGSTEPDE
jgi:hypothetical protein